MLTIEKKVAIREPCYPTIWLPDVGRTLLRLEITDTVHGDLGLGARSHRRVNGGSPQRVKVEMGVVGDYGVPIVDRSSPDDARAKTQAPRQCGHMRSR
jgi:hypothetical protein